MRSASAAVTAALLWALISDARGAEPEVRVEVTSSLPCANATSLMARVRARTPRARFEQGAEVVARATFTESAAGHVVGELVLAPNRQPAPARRVEADNCRDALDGIALILALSLDPAALTTPGDSGSAAPATADATPNAAAAKAASAPASPVSATPTTPDTRSPSSSSEFVVDAEPAAPALPWHLRVAVTANGELALAPAPSPMYGAGLSLTLALERASVWSPSLTLGAQRLQSGKSEHAGGTASFGLDALTLELCPLRVGEERLELRGCASALYGRLLASGSNTLNPVDEVGLRFAALGPAATLVWRVARPLELSLRLAPRVTLRRDRFEFGGAQFHEVEPLMFAAGLGLGLSLR